MKGEVKETSRHLGGIGVEGDAIVDGAADTVGCGRIMVVSGQEGGNRSKVRSSISRQPVDAADHTLILFTASEECRGEHVGLGCG